MLASNPPLASSILAPPTFLFCSERGHLGLVTYSSSSEGESEEGQGGQEGAEGHGGDGSEEGEEVGREEREDLKGKDRDSDLPPSKRTKHTQQ